MTLRDRFKGLGGGGHVGEARQGRPDRRRSKRVGLAVLVRVGLGDRAPEQRRLVNVSLHGLRVEHPALVARGTRVRVEFEGYPGVCGEVLLVGDAARVIESEPPGFALEINRSATRPDALEQYRKLVRHYLRHRPLLEEMRRGYVEGRCPDCGWLGRVGAKSMSCPVCGKPVRPVSGSEQ